MWTIDDNSPLKISITGDCLSACFNFEHAFLYCDHVLFLRLSLLTYKWCEGDNGIFSISGVFSGRNVASGQVYCVQVHILIGKPKELDIWNCILVLPLTPCLPLIFLK